MRTSEALNIVRQAKGFMRPNEFDVRIGVPAAIRSQYGTAEILGLMAYSASIPGIAFGTATSPHETVQIALPTDLGPKNIDIGFRVSADAVERKIFEAWRKLIIPASNFVGYYDEIVADMTIQPLTKNDRRMLSVQISDAYPTTIGEVSLSYESGNQIATFNVSFTFRDYELE